MMPSCAIYYCKNWENHKTNACLTLHKFPKGELLRSKWIQVVQRLLKDDDWYPTDTCYLCTAHFDKKDVYFTKRRVLIATSAIPIENMTAPERYTLDSLPLPTPVELDLNSKGLDSQVSPAPEVTAICTDLAPVAAEIKSRSTSPEVEIEVTISDSESESSISPSPQNVSDTENGHSKTHTSPHQHNSKASTTTKQASITTNYTGEMAEIHSLKKQLSKYKSQASAQRRVINELHGKIQLLSAKNTSLLNKLRQLTKINSLRREAYKKLDYDINSLK